MTRTAVCTVLAANYVSAARTLARSLREQHPELEVYALFIDDHSKVVNTDEPFTAIAATELPIPDLEQFQFKYDIVEYATAVKPRLFEHLLATRGLDALVYLDPDILVTGRLDAVLDRLRDHDIVLTPHFHSDYPDGLPGLDTSLVLRHGLYNLGFMAMRNSAETLRCLRWWWSKLESHCTRDGTPGYYVDQKVMDLVPLLFAGIHIEKSRGLNVAYWNIHERHVRRTDGRWSCNGEPLVFFHFSSFDPHRPDRLAGAMPCPNSDGNEDLPRLAALYAERLLANGYDATRRIPYGHSTFANGEAILYATRRYYRGLPAAARCREPFSSAPLVRRNRLEGWRNRSATARRQAISMLAPLRRTLTRMLGAR